VQANSTGKVRGWKGAESPHISLCGASRNPHTSPNLRKATVLGVAEEISESLVDSVNAENESRELQRVKKGNLNRNKALSEELLKGKLDHLSEEEKASIEHVLLRYAHLFHDEDSNDFKGINVIEHKILTGDARPIKRPQYRVPYALRGEMKQNYKYNLHVLWFP
jgi:hypothetical protein